METRSCRDCRKSVGVEKLQKLNGDRWYCVSDCETNIRNSPEKLKQAVAQIPNYQEITQKVVELFKKGSQPLSAIADELDLKPSDALNLVTYAGATWNKDKQEWELIEPPDLDSDRKIKKLAQQCLDVGRKYKSALDKIEELEDRLNFLGNINQSPIPLKIYTSESDNERGEATAISLASDWHIEEVVTLAETHGLNEYNPEIAEARAKAYFRNLAKVVRLNRRDVDIPRLILWIGGDIINNYLREENLETNAFSPVEASLFAQELLIGGIDYLREDSELKEIIIVCSDGNHGRFPMQRKTKVGTRTQNSLENLLYHTIANYYRGRDERLAFSIAGAYHNYIDVYGKKLRFHHGDAIKYGGGVGGFIVPLSKYILKENQAIQGDMDFLGHFHSLHFMRNAVVNGSLVGFNSYAAHCGFPYEEPQQAFCLLDEKRGFTVRCPIFLS